MALKAFVFGKFLPFHKGHEALIRFARGHCDHLSVLICCSDREDIPGEIRRQWLSETFLDVPGIECRVLKYNEADFPNTSVSSRSVSEIWSGLFRQQFPDMQLVVTSEPYGDYVAEFMGIRHLSYDPGRMHTPIAASDIRKDPVRYWHFLPDAVKPFFSRKIVVLGTESTGKSILAERLSGALNASLVPETGRELIPDSNSFTMSDLYKVAALHAKRIDTAVRGISPFVVVDTDVFTTASYAQFVFGQKMAITPEIIESNKAQLRLYLSSEVPFVQDGTRLDESRRNALDASHRAVLQAYGMPFIEVNGNWDDRFLYALEYCKSIAK